MGFCAPFITVMNILTIASSRKYRLNVQHQDSEESKKRKKTEIRLFVLGFVVSASYVTSELFIVLYTLSLWKISVFADINDDLMYTWYMRFYDFFSMCDPYLLVFLSPTVRAKFFQMLSFNRFGKTTPTSSGAAQLGGQNRIIPSLVNVA